MDRQRFESLVSKAVDDLPVEFLERLENVDVVIEDLASPYQLRKLRLRDPLQLLGLYEGVPQTVRTRGYSLVPPDKITVFQKPVETRCRNDTEIEAEIKRVVIHEVAHHFGIDDAALEQFEKQKRAQRRRTDSANSK